MATEFTWLLLVITLVSVDGLTLGASHKGDDNVVHMEMVRQPKHHNVHMEGDVKHHNVQEIVSNTGRDDTARANVKKGRNDVKTVHVVSMNHLDVGYASFINHVLNEYFQIYFPRAAQLGLELKEKGYTETFIYTTHPWLVTLYMDCPPNLVLSGVKLLCPNATEVVTFRSAVSSGYITWHAGPMNLQPENSPEWLLQAGLTISQDLDKMFNITRPMRVLSQRDVPGMSQSVIPSLVKAGVGAVSVGVNDRTPPPAVPSLFRWGYQDQEVLATWHPGGYPDNYGPDPAHPGGISLKDCVIIDGFPDVLCFAFRSDNAGPPANIQEILSYYEILRAEYPGAHIRASTLEDYFIRVEPMRSQLPLVTMEIGDTWMVGVASDPRKNAEFRATARVLGTCLAEGRCQMTDARVWNASRFLCKLPEHTWGLSTAGDTINWRNDKFHNVSQTLRYRQGVSSWLEQRDFTYTTISALNDHQVVQEISEEFKKLKPGLPDLKDYSVLPPGEASCLSKDGFKIMVGKDGAIRQLIYNGVSWIDPGTDQYMSKFVYISYNKTDFDRFGDQYDLVINSSTGFNKPNMTVNAHPESRDWPSVLTAAYTSKDSSRCDMWLHLQPEDKTASEYYGAPQHVWLRYYGDTSAGKPKLGVEVLLLNKTSTRLPEALYLVFKPSTRAHHKWWYSKIGHQVDPLNVILNGSHYQHGIDDSGVYYIDQSGKGLQITSPDVPLACPITNKMTNPTSFPAPLKPITDELTGVAFNFYNNLWNTNYILWYPYLPEDQDFKARFNVYFM